MFVFFIFFSHDILVTSSYFSSDVPCYHGSIIGLQSTGEARAKVAAKTSGIDYDEGGEFDNFISAPNEELKRIIMHMFPLPVRFPL